MRALRVTFVLVLGCALAGGAGAFRYNTDASTYPFLQDSSGRVLNWYSSSVATSFYKARALAISHNGIWVLPEYFHVSIAEQYTSPTNAVACYRAADCLCETAGGHNRVFPVTGPVNVTFRGAEGTSAFTQTFVDDPCSGPDAGVQRRYVGGGHYDVSTCDIEHMKRVIVYHRDVVYVVEAPYPLWVHFCLIFLNLFFFGGSLDALSKLSSPVEKSNYALKVWDKFVLGVSFLSVGAVFTAYQMKDSFYTSEDRFSFYFLIASYCFYLFLIILQLQRRRKDYHGLFFDLYIHNMYLTFTASYISFDHPFSHTFFFLILFRQWDKLFRILLKISTELPVFLAFVRLSFDSFLLCLLITNAWFVSFDHVKQAYIWLFPLFFVSFFCAKAFFLRRHSSSPKSA